MPPTKTEILHAYRALYRTSLRAVHYSVPARYTLRSRLRLSFRSSPLSDFEPVRIRNTLTFLENAAKYRGMEHQILRNLLMVWYWEVKQWAGRSRVKEERGFRVRAFDGFYGCLRLLNESMGLCLR
jgi:hypothetical protein